MIKLVSKVPLLDGTIILPLGKGVFIGGKEIGKPMRGTLGREIAARIIHLWNIIYVQLEWRNDIV